MWSISRCLSKIPVQSLLKSSTRHYMKTSDKIELLLKQADRVPFSYELVYRHKRYKMGGFMYHSINFLSVLSGTTISYHVYNYGFKPREDTPEMFKMFENPIQAAILIISAIGMVLYASMIRSRYVIRIYYNEKNKMYKAIFHGKVPFTVEHHDFPAACMTYVTKNHLLPWSSILFHANGRKVLLFDDQFRTQGDLYAMMDPAELENENF